jgi:hypothetical protein
MHEAQSGIFAPRDGLALLSGVRSAQQYVCLLLRIERHKQIIEPFSQSWMCERAFF